jgi:tetratricopeptide (TPR) repeat protein
MSRYSISVLVLIASSFLPLLSWSQTGNKTVIGPRNPDLADGARELKHGNLEAGIELTLRSLTVATARERESGLSNLCAAYAMMGDLDAALEYCNQILFINDGYWRAYSNRAVIYILKKEYVKAEQDLLAGLAIHPHSSKLKEVKSMLLDATHPVEQKIVIDDRDMETAGKEDQ